MIDILQHRKHHLNFSNDSCRGIIIFQELFLDKI